MDWNPFLFSTVFATGQLPKEQVKVTCHLLVWFEGPDLKNKMRVNVNDFRDLREIRTHKRLGTAPVKNRISNSSVRLYSGGRSTLPPCYTQLGIARNRKL